MKLMETRISYLFFTGRHVYEVKKPVDFGFLRWIRSTGDLARGEVEKDVSENFGAVGRLEDC